MQLTDQVPAAQSTPPKDVQTLTILGATGSIGVSTLKVIALHPERFRVFAMTGHSQIDVLVNQALLFAPRYVVISDESHYEELADKLALANCYTEILIGSRALEEVSSAPEVDIVMSAIVGAAGLLPTLAAVKAGKRVLLANKEALVMSGELFMRAVQDNQATLLPIDSEHNAIYQCLPHHYQYGDIASSGIRSILLTGSGGPFLQHSLDDLALVTPEQACKHPNWSMGRKISVDSASMMNKGLEFIEAKWLFGVNEDDIKVVIHPQSTIHSMVQYKDGSVIAQMGNPDMRTPIAYGLSYPDRIESGVDDLDFSNLSDFSFTQADPAKYPNLYLAIDACRAGQAATTSLNAANEIAVEAFLQQKIGFLDIAKVNNEVLQHINLPKLDTIAHILEQDRMARIKADKVIQEMCKC